MTFVGLTLMPFAILSLTIFDFELESGFLTLLILKSVFFVTGYCSRFHISNWTIKYIVIAPEIKQAEMSMDQSMSSDDGLHKNGTNVNRCSTRIATVDRRRLLPFAYIKVLPRVANAD